MKSLMQLGILASALGLMAAPAHAIVMSATNNVEAVVDFGVANRSVTFVAGDLGGAQDAVVSVRITIDFMKCGGLVSDLQDLSLPCTDTGPAYASEIILRLTSPNGTTVNLVEAETYFGPGSNDPAPGDRITVTFDDSAALVGLSGFQTDTAGGVQNLGLFNGLQATGIWTLRIEDNAEDAPLGFASFMLDVTVEPRQAQAPLPATPWLFGIALAGLGAIRRRRC